jgi:hypothetical protein
MSKLTPTIKNSNWTIFQEFMFDPDHQATDGWTNQPVTPSDKITELTSEQAQTVQKNFFRYVIKTNSIEQLYPYLMSCGLTRQEILKREYECLNTITIKALAELHSKILNQPLIFPTRYMDPSKMQSYLTNTKWTLADIIQIFGDRIEQIRKIDYFYYQFPMLRNRASIHVPRGLPVYYHMFQVTERSYQQ